jgi:ribosomal protein S12 methylthiotransferase
MRRVFLVSSDGCDPFKTDLGLIRQYFRGNSYIVSKKIEKADTIVMHTCAFSKDQENKSVELLRNTLQKQKEDAKVIVTGCLPSINKARCDRIFNGTKISANALQELDKIINPQIKLRHIKYIDSPQSLSQLKGVFYFLRIGRGCLGKCGYCAVKLVFGRLKSRSALDILQEFNNAYARGYRNFALVAQDVGIYGRDYNSSLADCLRILCNKHPDSVFQLLNITPNMLKNLLPGLREFIRLGKISYIVIPIQSGSNRILQLMRRQYTVDEVKYLIKKTKEYNPNLSIKTDIMVGFPSEKTNDFLDTLKLVEWLSRYKVMVQGFVYSKRPNTEAGKMPNQIDEKTKNARLKKLYKMVKMSGILGDKKLFNRLKRKRLKFEKVTLESLNANK